MSATIIQFKPQQAGDPPRPRDIIDRNLWCVLLGMTYKQSNIAFELCFKTPDKGKATVAALGRYIEAMRVFEPALADFREELLKNMETHYPRAAKRIREGKPPRGRRKRALRTTAELRHACATANVYSDDEEKLPPIPRASVIQDKISKRQRRKLGL